MRRTHPALPLIVIAVLIALAAVAFAAQSGMSVAFRYFPQTGYFVREPLLAYFDQHGGEATFGPPLTDAYTSTDGLLVQTFERAQLQLSERGVGLSPIGRALRLGDNSARPAVAPQFSDSYAAHGGDAFFGATLSAALRQDGLLVQDFENARLVLSGSGARLAALGPAYLAVAPPPRFDGQASFRLRGTPMPPPAVRASVSVKSPSLGQGDIQTLFVVVEDEQGRPISGARALAVLRYNTGVAEVEMPPTDAAGLASASFIAPPAPSGSKVLVQMHLLVGETHLIVETAYFQWW